MESYGVGLDRRSDDVLYDIHDTTIAGNNDKHYRGWTYGRSSGGVAIFGTTWMVFFYWADPNVLEDCQLEG